MQTAMTAAGGLAMFLLAMLMMTDGLKTFAGVRLRQMLSRWTATPLRGVLAGVTVTALVQSSSAVTIATIGFVNAGMLTLRQALGVMFGANVGTTMTGWLVGLVGLGWRIDSLAVPLLTLGVVLRLTVGRHRWRGLGEALAGFGLFFLALSLLQDAFAASATTQGAAIVRGSDSPLLAFSIGFGLSLLTQSSSAALAIILSAAASGIVGLPAAAAAVVGANLGTTSTALLAVLAATPSAKRLAVGHIAFNAITGVIALLLLPVMLAVVTRLAGLLDLEAGAAPVLALFHTMFNMLGVLLMLPLAPRLAQRLERLFVTDEESLDRPQHLDRTLATTPALAVSALDAELRRLATAIGGLGLLALRSSAPAGSAGGVEAIERRLGAARGLGAAIVRYAAQVQTEAMQVPVAVELAGKLRAARYLNEAARLVPRITTLREVVGRSTDPATRESVDRVLTDVGRVFGHAAESDGDAFRADYAVAKSELLAAMVQRRIGIEAGEEMLAALSATRRMVEQYLKGRALTGRRTMVE